MEIAITQERSMLLLILRSQARHLGCHSVINVFVFISLFVLTYQCHTLIS